MRKFVVLLFLLLLGCDTEGQRVLKGVVQTPASSIAKVYLFAGQSNMPEAIPQYFQPLMDAATTDQVYYAWFAQSGATMLGQGGTNDWKIGGGSDGTNYATFLAAVLSKLTEIEGDGFTPEIRGFAFRQGEADTGGAGGAYTAAQVQTLWSLGFGRLLKFLTDDLTEAGYDTHNMRVIVQRIHATYPGALNPTYLAAVRAANEAQQDFLTTFTGYSTQVKSVVWQDTDSFTYDGTNVHYSVPGGQIESATAIYNYFQPYISETNTPPTINTSGFDSDAVAFLTAGSIKSQTIADAINTYVVGLKADGLWSKIVADYPFVGGYRLAHKYNLKNPLDTDGAYRLTFNTTVDHFDTGFNGSGSPGYADTHVAMTTLGQNTAGAGFYSGTSGQEGAYGWGGINTTNTSKFLWGNRWTDNLNYASDMGGEITGNSTTDGSGYHIMTRTSSSNFNTFIRGTKKANSSTSVAPDATTITIGARNFNGSRSSYSTKLWKSFQLFNASLSDADAANMKTRQDALQTAIGRP